MYSDLQVNVYLKFDTSTSNLLYPLDEIFKKWIPYPERLLTIISDQGFQDRDDLSKLV